jgi:hypothetical protein
VISNHNLLFLNIIPFTLQNSNKKIKYNGKKPQKAKEKVTYFQKGQNNRYLIGANRYLCFQNRYLLGTGRVPDR